MTRLPNLPDCRLPRLRSRWNGANCRRSPDWTPEHSGDSGMRIAADGTWFHDGSPITRPAMVRAFASLLTRDADGVYWLMTPYQKLSVEVEDAAFIATDVVERERGLAFRLNTDDIVLAGPDHPLIARGDPQTPALYLTVRHGCEARLNRSTYQQLAQIALAGDTNGGESGGEDWQVESQGARFSLLP